MSNGVFNFNFLALLFSEILGGSQITLGGPTPPGRPLADKFLYPKPVLYNIFTIALFNYVQCPRNYCDGVTLNQCLINNNNNNNLIVFLISTFEL